MNLSKSQIKKTGKIIRHSLRDSNIVNKEELNKLQEYRVSHQQSLQKVFNTLADISKRYYKGSLTVYRLKRIDTIIRKIKRYPTMDLSTMQDIAGCRTIVGSESQIRKIVGEIERLKNFEIISRDDYIKAPRDTGYSSYHIIIKPIDCERAVEVQLRTRANHHWATLVEITDLLFDVKLKEGQDHPNLFLFHKLLSIDKSKLNLDQKQNIIKIEKELGIISKIISVFRSNYLVAVDRWATSIPNDNYQYVIMEIDDNFSPLFEFYKDFEEAENAYFKKFALEEPNMVLIHVNDSDFEKIGLAYSNYVLTSHPSVRLYMEILQNTIIDYFKIKEPQKALIDYKYYDELIDVILASFENEVTLLKSKVDNDGVILNNVNSVNKYNEILEEWLDNFRDRLNTLKKSHNNFLMIFEKENNEFANSKSTRIKNNEESILKRLINLITGN